MYRKVATVFCFFIHMQHLMLHVAKVVQWVKVFKQPSNMFGCAGFDVKEHHHDDVVRKLTTTKETNIFMLKRLLAQYETISRVTNEQHDERAKRE